MEQGMLPINGNVVLYARVSTKKRESDTTSSQLEEMARWAYLNGYNIIGMHTDHCSGRSMDCREGLLKAIALANQQGASVAVCELSRLSRNVRDTAELMESNTKFIFTRSGVEMSKEMVLMASIFSQMESESISHRVSAGIQNLFMTQEGAREEWGRARHKATTIKAMNEGCIKQADDFASRNGEIAYELLESGRTLRQVAEIFMKMEIKTARGKTRWYANSIRQLVSRYNTIKP